MPGQPHEKASCNISINHAGDETPCFRNFSFYNNPSVGPFDLYEKSADIVRLGNLYQQVSYLLFWWDGKVKSLSRVWLFATQWTVARQACPSMEFSRQESWSGLPFPSPGDLPDPGIEPIHVSRIAGRHFTIWATWEAQWDGWKQMMAWKRKNRIYQELNDTPRQHVPT